MDRDELQRRIWDYKWYHVIDLPDGVRTPGMQINVPSQQKVLRAIRSLDLRDKSVLDIGCRDGLYAFEAEKLGARRVVAFDNDLSPGAVELLIPALNSRVEMSQLNLFDLRPESFGSFDVVLFAGVLYHLRYPFSAMKIVRDVVAEGGLVVIETAVFADENRHALLYCAIGDENPYDATSVTLFNLKGLRDSLRSFGLVTVSEGLQGGFKPSANDSTKTIDRVCVVCRKESSVVKKKVAEYWDGAHVLHSTGASSLD